MSSEDKPHKASKRKLVEARKRGELATSPEVNGLATYCAISASLLFLSEYMYDGLKRVVLTALKTVETASFDQQTVLVAAAQEILWTSALLLVPITIFGMLAAILAGLLQTRGVFSVMPLTPKPERLNPAQGLRALFTVHKLAEVAKSVVTVTALAWIVYVFVRDLGTTAIQLSGSTAIETLWVVSLIVKKLLIVCGLVFICAAIADYAQKHFLFLYQQRMSFDELKREFKEMNGDPYVRSKRRAVARELATTSIKQKIAASTVVITNPTHFAVALYFEENETPLPIVTAKGVDEHAAFIRETAKNSGVPLYEDRILARMLHAKVQEGDYINEEALSSVAAVFAWVFQLKETLETED